MKRITMVQRFSSLYFNRRSFSKNPARDRNSDCSSCRRLFSSHMIPSSRYERSTCSTWNNENIENDLLEFSHVGMIEPVIIHDWLAQCLLHCNSQNFYFVIGHLDVQYLGSRTWNKPQEDLHDMLVIGERIQSPWDKQVCTRGRTSHREDEVTWQCDQNLPLGLQDHNPESIQKSSEKSAKKTSRKQNNM